MKERVKVKMHKNIKHASSEKIEILNEIKDASFDDGKEYFIIAKKEDLYVIANKKGMNLIVDGNIVDMLTIAGKIGGSR